MKRKHNLQAVLDQLALVVAPSERKQFKLSITDIIRKHYFIEKNRCECCGRLNWKHGGHIGPVCAKGKCKCK